MASGGGHDEMDNTRFKTALTINQGDKQFKKPILNILELVEDVLIKILSDLEVPELLVVESVSKRFQFLTKKTIQLKKATVDERLCEQVVTKGGSLVDFIQLFGYGLKKVDISSFMFYLDIEDDTQVLQGMMMKFAVQFPNIVDFGRVKVKHLDHILAYVASFEYVKDIDRSCKLRHFIAVFEVTFEDIKRIRNVQTRSEQEAYNLAMKMTNVIAAKIDKVRQLCPVFDEFVFELDSIHLAPLLMSQPTFLRAYRCLIIALSTMYYCGLKSFKKLTLINEAYHGLLLTRNEPLLGHLSELNLLKDNGRDIFGDSQSHAENIREMIILAPNITSLSIWAEKLEDFPVLTGFAKLEKLSLKIPFEFRTDKEHKKLQKYFDARGSQLKELDITIKDILRPSKVELMIAMYCLKLEKLKFNTQSKPSIKNLIKVTTLTHL